MPELNRIFGADRRVRFAALLSLIMLVLIGGAFTARWSARARSQEQAEAAAATATPTAEPTSDNARDTAPLGPTAAGAPGNSSSAAPEERPSAPLPPAFTLTLKRTATAPADGQTRLLPTTTRYQRADGIYKLVHTYPAEEGAAARVEVAFGFTGLGVFRLDRERRRLVFLSPLTDDAAVDARTALLREDPSFDREEDVLGQQTLVLRMPAPWGEGYTEYYRAPALGGLLIKQVEESPRLGRRVMEPTELVLGEPAAGLFAELAQYPADYADYERTIARMDRGNGHETAQFMRELMRRMQAVKPGNR